MVSSNKMNENTGLNHESIFNYDNNFNITQICSESGGYIAANKNLYSNISNTPTTKLILKEAIKGTSIVKLGSGDLKLMIIAGMHGDELPSQIAALMLINKLRKCSLNGTIYVIPFAAPEASMYNRREYRGKDLNRNSMNDGTIGRIIIDKIKDLEVSAVADFHSTAPNANPGKEGVFCSLNPSPKSYDIASFITNDNKSSILNYTNAGESYKGALEDECNLNGIPAVTCEVLSPIGVADLKSSERSLTQMFSFLKYFKIL